MLGQALEAIQNHLRGGHYPNEASVSTGIVLPILGALGWPTADPQVVSPEYRQEGRRVDFALFHPLGTARVFVEVKQVGQSSGAERQLFEYAFHKGVPLVILTDGREWNFFLPAELGDYEQRRVYKLDVLERTIEESSYRFGRYLEYAAVCSGEALTNARNDYRDVARVRQIRETLPVAWKKLVEEEEKSLLELLADRVADLCGFKPDLDTVARFLKGDVPRQPVAPISPSPSSPRLSNPEIARPSQPVPSQSSLIGFSLLGKSTTCRNAVDVLVKSIEALASRDPEFLSRFVSLPKHGRSR
jgi:predicted type IV restriction endonuclease